MISVRFCLVLCFFFFLLLSLPYNSGCYSQRDVFGPVRFSRFTAPEEEEKEGATAAALLSESAAEESRDAPFLRFSSFPPFIRAPVVVPRLLVSWFLLCHTRPYIHTPRVFFLHTGLRVRLGYIMPG